jgi:hypothetical protein
VNRRNQPNFISFQDNGALSLIFESMSITICRACTMKMLKEVPRLKKSSFIELGAYMKEACITLCPVLKVQSKKMVRYI